MLPFPAKDGLIVLLTLALVACMATIWRLRRIILDERQRRIMPMLTIEFDMDHARICLVNESACHAKDVKVGDIDLTLDYTFKKHVTISFETLSLIKPGEKVPLLLNVSSGGHPLSSEEQQGLFAHISLSPLKTEIIYSNLENKPFKTIVVKKGGRIRIEKITSLP